MKKDIRMEVKQMSQRRPGRPPSPDGEGPKPIRAVQRALSVLEAVAFADDGLSFADISKALDIPAATTHRLLATLGDTGYLHLDKETGAYLVGSRFTTIAGRVLRQRTQMRVLARPFLTELVENTEETANLAILDGIEASYLDQVQSEKIVRVQTFLRVPLYSSAIGKALLAFQPEETVEDVVSAMDLQAFTENTLTDQAKLLEALQAIRVNGYAVDDEELEIGVRCVGAPVLVAGRAVASVSIAGPTTRVTRARVPEIAGTVIDVADRLSKVIAGRFPDLVGDHLTDNGFG